MTFPPCQHYWHKATKWNGHDWEWETFHCNKPSNGWLGPHPAWNRCKRHQLDIGDALHLLQCIRQLQYRWRTDGYLGGPPDLLANLADLGVWPA